MATSEDTKSDAHRLLLCQSSTELNSYERSIIRYHTIITNLRCLERLEYPVTYKKPRRHLRAVQYLMKFHPQMARKTSDDLLSSLGEVIASRKLELEDMKKKFAGQYRAIIRWRPANPAVQNIFECCRPDQLIGLSQR